MQGVPGWWLRRGVLSTALAPLGVLYGAVSHARRRYWARHAPSAPLPVIVVGNLFVGGSGKTPLVIHLVERARALGMTPGVILRGYGGRGRQWPQPVTRNSDPAIVGDEAVLIAERAGCPVAAGPDRVAAARLLAGSGCDLLISDDGLQHYRLRRQAEVIVIDAARGLGNGRCLPAGPLREPPARLRDADLVLARDGTRPEAAAGYRLQPGALQPLEATCQATPPVPGSSVHAVAGIGHPGGFFAMLEGLGYKVLPHPFPDHHRFRPVDLEFDDDRPVVMTEKDAVKCRHLIRGWYLPVTAVPDEAAATAMDRLILKARNERIP
ncbi:tetraacyldisaccharide 4'-kinase [Arhodomonas sp. SL1]|uniref:tetraacyldisaccharide 4'-kinase n=1 Tax=Arhodomonas sp. SL1 TaxID=3425691 RepID=UPI003F881E3E